ncbi:MAG: hypothetical protein KIT45_07895 [Fimbriimonadia bacterium]|nr:hypothetical protein [Fimbriimonadia bacterium]
MKFETYYRPHLSNPRIREMSPKLGELGGTFWVFIWNPQSKPAHVSGVEINGVSVDALQGARGLYWYRITPEPLPARGGACLILNMQRELLEKPTLALTLITDSNERFETTLKPIAVPLVPAYAWIEGREVRLFVRNDDPQRRCQLRGLRLGGKSVSMRATTRDLMPGEVSLIKAPLPRSLASGEYISLQVEASYGGQTVMAGGQVRNHPRHFPVGLWRGEAFQNSETRKDLRERGFDCSVFSGSDSITAEERMLREEIGPKEKFFALPFSGFPRPSLPFIERNVDNPYILTYMIMDEPDWREPKQHDGYHLAFLCERSAQYWRDRKIPQPVYLNLARSRRFGEFATIPDIACYDAYRVGAPMPDASPFDWGNYLELAGAYTEDLRKNCEPLPFWVWAQGAHKWDERVWVNDKLGRPCPTPEETRVQLWFQLSRGAKGVLWFIGFDEKGFRDYYMKAEDIPALRQLSEDQRRPLVDQLVEMARETYEEQTRLNRFMNSVREKLLGMDYSPVAQIETASNKNKLDAMALVGEKDLALFLTNFDYEMDPVAYRFQEQRNIRVRVRCPKWLRPKKATLRTPQGEQALAFQRAGEDLVVEMAALPEQVASVWWE